MTICAELRVNALALSDLFPKPNLELGAFGNEDLNIYNNFLSIKKESMDRVEWWPMLYENHGTGHINI